jgi:hypothetical protein
MLETFYQEIREVLLRYGACTPVLPKHYQERRFLAK